MITIDSIDHLDLKSRFSCIQAIMQNSNTLQHKCSVDLFQTLILKCLPTELALAAFTDLCLKKLDNKFFKVHQDMLEYYISIPKCDIPFAVGLIRKIAQHPKTEFSQNHLEVL
jgi:hypothetical protein